MKKKSDPCGVKWSYAILIGGVVFGALAGIFWAIVSNWDDEDDAQFNTYLTLAIIFGSLFIVVGLICPLIYYFVTQSNAKCRKLRSRINKNVRYIYLQ